PACGPAGLRERSRRTVAPACRLPCAGSRGAGWRRIERLWRAGPRPCGAACCPVPAASYPPLAQGDVPLSGAIPAGILAVLPIGPRSERLQPQVDARLLPGEGQRLDRHFGTGDAYVPAVCLTGDRDRLGRALQWTGPVDIDAPD